MGVIMSTIKKYLSKGLSLMLSASLFLFPPSSSMAKKSSLSANDVTYSKTTEDSTAKYVKNSIDSELNFSMSDTEESPYGQGLQNLDEINEKLEDYGKMTLKGMPQNEYDEAMNIPWRAIEVEGSPENLNVDFLETINYEKVENILYNMAKYDGVSLYDIGNSGENRNIYMIILDFNNSENPNSNKKNMLFTGGVHAREFAGTDFLLKMLNDLLVESQSNLYIRSLLENIKIICVPLVNPDGRELIINGEGAERKANAIGIDLNRNMPSLNAGQLAKDVPQRTNKVEREPSLHYFPGYYLGSESESKAMIKFFTIYVSDTNTLIYVDLHQMGEITYYNKNFLSKESDELSKSLALKIKGFLDNTYKLESESKNYGIEGLGGTMTDFAMSVAAGMKFSYEYGRLVMLIDGQEQPLICFKDVDNVIKYYRPINRNFKFSTIEIGNSSKSLGASLAARKLRLSSYNSHNWENFLQNMIEYTLGKDLVKNIKNGIESENISLSAPMLDNSEKLTAVKNLRSQLIVFKNDDEKKQAKLSRRKHNTVIL